MDILYLVIIGLLLLIVGMLAFFVGKVYPERMDKSDLWILVSAARSCKDSVQKDKYLDDALEYLRPKHIKDFLKENPVAEVIEN